MRTGTQLTWLGVTLCIALAAAACGSPPKQAPEPQATTPTRIVRSA